MKQSARRAKPLLRFGGSVLMDGQRKGNALETRLAAQQILMKSSIHKTRSLVTLCFSGWLVLALAHAALSQQPPAGRGGGARGGGFTEPDPIDFNDHTGW